jgi:hypothetical protein
MEIRWIAFLDDALGSVCSVEDTQPVRMHSQETIRFLILSPHNVSVRGGG